jgi:pyrroline-5-carboxylate reductase
MANGDNRPTLLLVGCGKMGHALLKGWRAKKSAAHIHIVEPVGNPTLLGEDVSFYASVEAMLVPPRVDAIVLAVKPQVMASVAPSYKSFAAAGALVISIAAGTTVDQLSAWLGKTRAIVRVMPNTPAAVGAGIAACYADPAVSAEQRVLAATLMEAVGQIAWIETEAAMHAVTAVSGSGPAYVFAFIEALTKAGENAGLPPVLAAHLARETVIGSALLAQQSSEPPDKLRADVTSPGGTTAAGLAVLQGEGAALQDLLTRTVAAAAKRSRELAEG